MKPPPQADPVRSFLSARAAEGWMPGAVWVVQGPAGRESHGAAGSLALKPGHGPATFETVYDLASLTKMLATAPLLLLQQQEGALDLDQPVGRQLPELNGSVWSRATMRSLACHTAGLPAWRPLYLTGKTIESYIEQIARIPPAVAPGESLYSDLGFILLGAVLERVSGCRLDRLFTERIARPLGLSRTGFASTPERFAAAAPTEQDNRYERGLAGEAGVAHDWRDEIAPGQTHDANAHTLGGVAGHAGLFGTAAEVVALAGEFLDPQCIGLSAASCRLLLEAQQAGRTVGLVTGDHSRATRGILPGEAPGHTGFTGTSLWLVPAEKRIYLLLTNRVHPIVEPRDFQLLRRGFHRIARSCLKPAAGSANSNGPG